MFIRAYFRASTTDQDATRAIDMLARFVAARPENRLPVRGERIGRHPPPIGLSFAAS